MMDWVILCQPNWTGWGREGGRGYWGIASALKDALKFNQEHWSVWRTKILCFLSDLSATGIPGLGPLMRQFRRWAHEKNGNWMLPTHQPSDSWLQQNCIFSISVLTCNGWLEWWNTDQVPKGWSMKSFRNWCLWGPKNFQLLFYSWSALGCLNFQLLCYSYSL